MRRSIKLQKESNRMHANAQKLSNLRPLKCIIKYSFKSGLLSGVGFKTSSERIVFKSCVKCFLAVLQSVFADTVGVSQHASHCHLQFFHFSSCQVVANAWIVFFSSAPALVLHGSHCWNCSCCVMHFP